MEKKEIEDWENRTGWLSKADLYDMALLSEIRIYEDQIPDGEILDIGAGLGSEVIYFLEKKRKVTALDKEPIYLNKLMERTSNCKNLICYHATLPEGKLPEKRFSLIIMSNILHFLDFKGIKAVCSMLPSFLNKNGIILFRAHSKDHPYAVPGHPKHSRIKYFFSEKEIKNLFNEKRYDILFFSNYHRRFSDFEIKLQGLENDITKHKAGFTAIFKMRGF
jgi:cyclopropane fatty-acyl-phospholipid synthase-like methyltransferase